MTIKEQKIIDLQEAQTKEGEAIDGLIELIAKLEEYDKKNIDKRFFEKYFLTKGEYRDYLRFSISEPKYSFKTEKRIIITQHFELEINSRERTHILEVAKTALENWQSNYNSRKKRIEEVEAIDEDAIIADLLAVYQKHGKPDIWRNILEEFRVKYPQE